MSSIPIEANDQQRVTRGAAAYFVRHVAVTGLGFGSNLLLLKLLQPTDFGIIAILNLGMAILTIFAEGGLNVFLIQRQGELDRGLLSQFLCFQASIYLAVHGLLTAALIVLTFLRDVPSTLLYLWCVTFAVLPALMRGSAFVVLEKQLHLTRVAIIESVEAVFYAGVAVTFAWFGWGVWSLVFAVLTRSLTGWLISRRFALISYRWESPSWSSEIREGLRFGFHYHTSSLLNIARGLANPLIVGAVLGLSAVGYCDRSAFLAAIPLTLVGTVQGRVLFPYYSRIQGDLYRTLTLFSRTLFFSGFLDKALFVPLLLLVPSMPFILGTKWQPAVPVIELMIVGNMGFGAFISSATPLLNGTGHIQWIARVSIASTLALWAFCWPAMEIFGLKGFAYVSLINWLPVLWLYWRMRREWTDLRVAGPWLTPVAAAVGAVICARYLLPGVPATFGGMAALAGLGLAVYLLLLGLLDFHRLTREVLAVLTNLRRRTELAHA